MCDPDSAMGDPADSAAWLRVATVTASLGPAGPLLRSLSHRPEGVSEGEIKSLEEDLEGLCVSLMGHPEVEEPSSTAMSLMSDIRELRYDIKNYFDDAPFILKQDDDAELTPEEMRQIAQLEFKLFVARAKRAIERRKNCEIELLSVNKAKFLSEGCRRWIPVLHAELIDRGRMDTLANKLMGTSEENPLKKAVVSLVGLEGVGKTTLAKRLYYQIGGTFQCRAFVRVSHNPDMRTLLASIFTQIQLPGLPVNACCSDAQHLIKNIKRCLQDKRYLIILDDLWSISVWDIIRRAFPDDDYGSRILTTTQCENVASACCSYNPEYIFKMEPLEDDQSERLLFGMVFGSEYHVGCSEDFASISDVIISKSGGLPLSIVNLASLLPAPGEPTRQQWFDFRDSLPPTLRRSPSSEGIKEVLNLIYNHLSPELKTCLLYLVLYPEGYTINKHDLVKQWVAEGFTGEGQNKEETAGEYFDELVSRGMIQVVDINYRGILSCTLHHIVHDLSVKKSMEGNFIISVDYFQKAVWLPDKVRRLSVQFGGARSARLPAGITLSEVRSLAFFGFYGCADFIAKCKLLRVLTLHLWAGDCVSEEEERPGIPPSGRKKVLTYDLSGISKLLPLRYLKIACNIAVQLPDDFQALQYLETLEVDATVVAVPSDIGRLSRLSSLKIAVGVLARQDISILQALQALSSLSLHVLEEQVGMIVFDKGGFSVLKYFKFRCSVPCLKFEAGSIPALQNLDLNFNAHEADQRGIVPIGIEHLPGLKEVNAEIWGTDNDVGSTFRTAISNHPSNPRIVVQLVDSSIFYGDTTPSMGTEEKVYMSKDDGMGEEKKQTADSSTSTLPLLERMSTLLGSSLPVQGAAKKPTLEIETDSIEVKAQTFAYCPEIKIDGPEVMDILDLKPSSSMNKQTDMNWQPGREDEKKQSDIIGDPVNVPWKDENVNIDPEKTVKYISTRMEEDANLLERTHDGMSLWDAQHIDFHMLKTITDDFSEKLKIGSGRYGVVYKGVLNGDEIAVKMLFPVPGLDDETFKNECSNLKRVQHKNVIRMIGYCYEIRHMAVESQGKYVWSQVIDRALCFEYMKGGSLATHISEESCKYDWPTTYNIIEGTCEGLHYLHKGRGEKNYIYHLDLKPDNILLDENLVPKIGDFGLSKLFGESKTYETSKTKGTIGFMPPEYITNAKVTPKTDVFSLGVIIFFMLSGKQGYSDYSEALLRPNFSAKHRQEFMESVQAYWKKKMEATEGYRWDRTDVLGIRKCLEIAMSCVRNNRDDRPSTSMIIEELKKLEAQIEEMLKHYPKQPITLEKITDLGAMSPERTDVDDSNMVPARSLTIAWANNPQYWTWTKRSDSRIGECAEVVRVFFLNVSMNIAPKPDQPPATIYTAHLVYKLASNTSGLQDRVQTARKHHYEENITTRQVSLHPKANGAGRANGVTYPITTRPDGWLELKLAEFSNDREVTVEVSGEDARQEPIRGLIIKGMDVRRH